MINRGFVHKNKSMDMSHQFDARILFQTQWDPIAFELLCINVSHLSATGPEEFSGSSGKVIQVPETLIELSLDGEFTVQCKKLFYKLCPEKYGNLEHLGSEIPSCNMVCATLIEPGWRQCSNCSEAWQIEDYRKISTCPKCNTVTELEVIT